MYKRPMQSINNRANNWMVFQQTKALNDPVLSSGSSSVALATVPSPLWRKSNEAIGLDDNDASLSSGYGGYYCDNGINLAILILTLAGLAAMFWTLYTKITMLVGRRRRDVGLYNTPVQKPPYTYTFNLEDLVSEIYWGRKTHRKCVQKQYFQSDMSTNEKYDKSFVNQNQT